MVTPICKPLTTAAATQRFFELVVGENYEKGRPYLFDSGPDVIAFAANNYRAGRTGKFLYGCHRVEVNADTANTRIASETFNVGDIVYWHAGNQKFTVNAAGAHKCARCLKYANYSFGGVPMGAKLLLEFTPDA